MRVKDFVDGVGARFLNESFGMDNAQVEGPQVDVFNKAFEAKYKYDSKGPGVHTQYDAVMAIALAMNRAGIDRPALAQHAATVTLRMIFEHGFFHADPHPGNFFIETDGSIGLIDFGMVGTVDPATRAALRAVLVALVERDTAPLVDAFVALGMTTTPLDPNQLAPDIDNLISRHLSLPLAEIRLGILLRDLFAIVRRHRLRLPPNLAALAKTLAMSEGIAAQLDPSFEMTTAIAIYLPHLLHADPAPGAPRSSGSTGASPGG